MNQLAVDQRAAKTDQEQQLQVAVLLVTADLFILPLLLHLPQMILMSLPDLIMAATIASQPWLPQPQPRHCPLPSSTSMERPLERAAAVAPGEAGRLPDLPPQEQEREVDQGAGVGRSGSVRTQSV
jgi:hypothetical protein